MLVHLRRTYHKWQRRLRRQDSQLIPTLVIIMLCIGIAYFAYQVMFSLALIDHVLAQTVLSWGMPTISGESQGYPGWKYTMRSIIYMITDYDLGNPQSFFASTLPTCASLTSPKVYEQRSSVFLPELSFAPEPTRPTPIRQPVDVTPVSQEPKVLIYHTHSSEMYLGPAAASQTRGSSHFVFRSASDDKITGVMEVGHHLAKALQSHGIGVVHDTRIHDWPSLARSYLNSERTVRELLIRYQNIQFVFDVHRDAGVPDPVVTIGGKRVAKVLLVLGTAQDIPQEHPNFRSNMAFAHEIQRVTEQMYPGLMRPIQVRRDARYNQHLHRSSVILEIGSVDNTLEQALLAAELLANVVAKIAKQRNS